MLFLEEEDPILSCAWAIKKAVLNRLASIDIVLKYPKVSMVGISCSCIIHGPS